jgi:soluble lytic murein transglycosylase-like protein
VYQLAQDRFGKDFDQLTGEQQGEVRKEYQNLTRKPFAELFEGTPQTTPRSTPTVTPATPSLEPAEPKPSPLGAAPGPRAALTPREFRQTLARVGQSVGVAPAVLQAVVQAEASGPEAVSPKGAIGVMQLMPETAERFGVDPRDPRDNIRGGALYLRYLIGKYGMDHLPLVFAAYNAGEGAVRDAGNRVPDFPETRQYVQRALRFMAAQRAHDQRPE